jgi:hypothetical protein
MYRIPNLMILIPAHNDSKEDLKGDNEFVGLLHLSPFFNAYWARPYMWMRAWMETLCFYM